MNGADTRAAHLRRRSRSCARTGSRHPPLGCSRSSRSVVGHARCPPRSSITGPERQFGSKGHLSWALLIQILRLQDDERDGRPGRAHRSAKDDGGSIAPLPRATAPSVSVRNRIRRPAEVIVLHPHRTAAWLDARTPVPQRLARSASLAANRLREEGCGEQERALRKPTHSPSARMRRAKRSHRARSSPCLAPAAISTMIDADARRITHGLRCHASMAARKARTAPAMPSSSASAVSAWPMDTSSTPGTAAEERCGRLSQAQIVTGVDAKARRGGRCCRCGCIRRQRSPRTRPPCRCIDAYGSVYSSTRSAPISRRCCGHRIRIGIHEQADAHAPGVKIVRCTATQPVRVAREIPSVIGRRGTGIVRHERALMRAGRHRHEFGITLWNGLPSMLNSRPG